MHSLKLKEKVTVTGKDFWGRSARIVFDPYDAPGWYWKYHPDEEPVQISAGLLQRRPRRVVLAHKDAVMETFEHVAPLRWTGLINGVCISSSAHPPFFGRTHEFWRAIEPKCIIDTSREVPWCSVSEPVVSISAGCGGYTSIEVGNEKYCSLSLSCSYTGLGDQELQVKQLDGGTIQVAFFAYTQGWPRTLYYLSFLASKLGWPHHEHVLWPQKVRSRGNVLKFFLWHRLLDVLGVMAFAHPTALLSAHVTSVTSGHEADIAAVKKAKSFLRLL